MTPHKFKPFFTYFGAKWRSAPRYPRPRHDTIIEPFAGAAGYSMRYYDRRIILTDKDPVIAGIWQYLIRVSENEILSLPDLEPFQKTIDLSIPQEAKWLIGFWLNKGTTSPCITPSKWMRKGINLTSSWGKEIRFRIASQLKYIRHWKVSNEDYKTLDNLTATWFVDPPYQNMGKRYKFSSKLIDYSGLAFWCRQRNGFTIVCENLGADWLPFEMYMKTKTVGGRTPTNISNEAIWTHDSTLEETT